MGICNDTSLSYPHSFHSVGICNDTSLSYPHSFLSVGICNDTSLSYPRSFLSVGICNDTSLSYPHSFLSVGICNKTSLSYPHTFTLRRKKGTEKLAPITCAHVVAKGFQQKRTAPPDVDAAETELVASIRGWQSFLRGF